MGDNKVKILILAMLIEGKKIIKEGIRTSKTVNGVTTTYCLSARYYDSQTGRFINADSLMAGANGGLQRNADKKRNNARENPNKTML